MLITDVATTMFDAFSISSQWLRLYTDNACVVMRYSLQLCLVQSMTNMLQEMPLLATSIACRTVRT